jgi:hypothetical protein
VGQTKESAAGFCVGRLIPILHAIDQNEVGHSGILDQIYRNRVREPIDQFFPVILVFRIERQRLKGRAATDVPAARFLFDRSLASTNDGCIRRKAEISDSRRQESLGAPTRVLCVAIASADKSEAYDP